MSNPRSPPNHSPASAAALKSSSITHRVLRPTARRKRTPVTICILRSIGISRVPRDTTSLNHCNGLRQCQSSCSSNSSQSGEWGVQSGEMSGTAVGANLTFAPVRWGTTGGGRDFSAAATGANRATPGTLATVLHAVVIVICAGVSAGRTNLILQVTPQRRNGNDKECKGRI
jgi:hypothetical protein